MSCDGQREFICGNALAIIANATQPETAALDIDLDPSRACIKTVFKQFLQHGCGSFHHLAGGDLIDQLGGQFSNRHERKREYRNSALRAA